MNITTILKIAVLFLSFNLNGQTRTIIGRVISEDLEPLPMLDIRNSDSVLLGKTDIDGRFKISIPQETDSLLFCYLGMEWTDIVLKRDCDVIEVIILLSGTYDFMSFKKIDKIRKKRFDELPILHFNAVKAGLFTSDTICYEREFKPDKPALDVIRKELQVLSKSNTNDFKELSKGDIVKIPFGIDTSENDNRIGTHYAPCKDCTEEDFDYLIEGEIINKHKRKLTLEIRITKMSPFNFLTYRGETLKVGSSFKYKMKYFEVIINK